MPKNQNSMSELRYTDQMFFYLRNHCSDALVDGCLGVVNLIPSDHNRWDITDYVTEEIDGVSITDKLNLVWCFLNNVGTVVYQGTEFMRNRQSFLMTALVSNGIINQQQEADILMPWIDCTHGEPHFDLENNNE